MMKNEPILADDEKEQTNLLVYTFMYTLTHKHLCKYILFGYILKIIWLTASTDFMQKGHRVSSFAIILRRMTKTKDEVI